jgi:hypothetical protein
MRPPIRLLIIGMGLAPFLYASYEPLWRMRWETPDSGMDGSFQWTFDATEVDGSGPATGAEWRSGKGILP